MTKILTAMATLLLTCHQTRRAYLDVHVRIDAYIGNEYNVDKYFLGNKIQTLKISHIEIVYSCLFVLVTDDKDNRLIFLFHFQS